MRFRPENGREANTRFLIAVLAVALLVLALPAISHACAVCSALGNERSRRAFFDMTIFMSVTPLGLLAWGVSWLGFKGRTLLKAEFEERQDPTEQAKPKE